MKFFFLKIPIVGQYAKKAYRKIKGIPEFKSSEKYWEDRYKSGGNSGAGSYNNLAEFKGEVINSFIQKEKIFSIIEFGCGDGNQLKYLNIKEYIGFDVSEKAIELCTEMYKNDNSKEFKSIDAYGNERAELTMSLDVIYHLVEDQTYIKYMSTLFDASDKYVIIYSSNNDKKKSIVPHVKHRKFTDWVEENQKNFKLLEHIPNKYPLIDDGARESFADFYVYKKYK
jgi:SAM-dependent methyltransferase